MCNWFPPGTFRLIMILPFTIGVKCLKIEDVHSTPPEAEKSLPPLIHGVPQVSGQPLSTDNT